MIKDSVFEYLDYKKYLQYRLSPFGSSRGMRSRLAELLKVRPASVTHILSGVVQLSLEHVPTINRLLQHNETESEYLMLLVSYTQAVSTELRKHFRVKMDAILEGRRVQADWIPEKSEISEKDEAQFFSDWYYQVTHVLTNIPEFQTKFAIAKKLKLSLATVSTTLDFLLNAGLVKQVGDRFQSTEKRFHIKKDSKWAVSSHLHARHLAIRSLSEQTVEDFHYSFAMSVSIKNIERIRKRLLECISEIEPIVTESNDEELCLLAMDFFKI